MSEQDKTPLCRKCVTRTERINEMKLPYYWCPRCFRFYIDKGDGLIRECKKPIGNLPDKTIKFMAMTRTELTNEKYDNRS